MYTMIENGTFEEIVIKGLVLVKVTWCISYGKFGYIADVSKLIMGFRGFPMIFIEFIAFVHHPTRSVSSHDGGLVDLFCWVTIVKWIVKIWSCDWFWVFKEIILKRLSDKQELLYMWMSLQACKGSFWSLSSLVLSNVLISWTIGSDEKIAPNKAISNLNWEIGIVLVSLSIDSPWQLGPIVLLKIFFVPTLQFSWFCQTHGL